MEILAEIDQLQADLIAAPSGNVTLDVRVAKIFGHSYLGAVTSSLDTARDFLVSMFPGWMYRIAECSVSDDAWLVPDFNHPTHGEALQKAYPDALKDPVEYFKSDIDLRPPGRPAIAMCLSALEVKAFILRKAAADKDSADWSKWVDDKLFTQIVADGHG